MTNRSCFDSVFALVYNLGTFLRRLALPKWIKKWSLPTLREKLIKIGARVVKVVSKEIVLPCL